MTMIDPECDTVGIIGWGRMGQWIGHWLIDRGWSVVMHDVSPEARSAAQNAGALVAETAVGVFSEAALTLVVVVDDEQVIGLLSDAGGLASARHGSTVAICSSVSPATAKAMHDAGQAVGVHVVDVALVGGERGAEQGGLQLMCGGSSQVLDDCLPALSAFAIDVCHIGGIGAGQVAKCINNLMLWACIRADYEVLNLAKTYGIQPSKLRAMLSVGTGANRALTDWSKQRLRFPKKDLEIGLSMARVMQIEMPLMECLQPLVADLTREDLIRLR